MRPNRYTITAVFFLILCQVTDPAFSQLGISFNLKKPKEYDEQLLRSEKSEEKKFTLPRRLIQNMVTHYNYFFNANNKLNDVLERAKTAFRDDYSSLLPFYNYSLDATVQDSIQLDSVTYKSSTAIALHDLRNDWIDNMYLLWGASYYLQKKFDSAYLMFQFINYAFAPKEKDGYYKSIGSSRDGNTAFSISTREKKGVVRKIFSEPPSRNDAFIWQIRNFLAQEQFAEAASLIITLKNDPAFPKRLQNDLHEVQAYWFYKQSMWDSAAVHLVKALDNATNIQEKARWVYLSAQLYELSGRYKESEKYYTKVSSLTTDLIMDIYARLFAIRVNKDGGDKAREKNVAELLRMAKKDKYLDYRDIIYYMAAQMELEGNNIDEAMKLLLKSTQFTSNDPAQRNRAFLKLAEISYERKQYRLSYNYYDSMKLDDPSLKNKEELVARKKMLGGLAMNIEIIERQDSMQRIAALPEDERKDFVKKLVRQLRKQQGLKEEPVTSAGTPFPASTIPAVFQPGQQKGEWYFYNTANRTRGQAEFKSKWGSRPNIDNWRRSNAILGMQGMQNNPNQQGIVTGQGIQGTTPELSFERMYANLPLAKDQMKMSDDSLQAALFALGKIYVQEIEDCSAGTETFEKLRSRYPEFQPMADVLFNLYYCYNKYGEINKAAAVKKLMNEKYSAHDLTTIVNTGKNPKSSSGNSEATKAYERIYDLFIEGNFDKAVSEKKYADSIYGKNFWTPQLLYIEAVYYIKQRNDSTAKQVLSNLIGQFTNTPMAKKATNLLEVLNRRAEIENELRNLVITRNQSDTPTTIPVSVPIVNNKPVPKDSVRTITPPIAVNKTVPKDTVAVNQPPPTATSSYSFKPNDAHYVALVLNKVDLVFVNEAKNAFTRYNKETIYNRTMSEYLADFDAENRLLIISPFKDAADAMNYITETKPRTGSEIIPWLKGGKYYFIILSDSNYDLLKANKDLDNYKAFLNQHFPGKF